MNYFVINRPSNLVTGVITSSSNPKDTNTTKFVVASDPALIMYYKLLSKRPSVLPDIGEIMSMSQYTNDVVMNGKSGKATPRHISYR